MLRSSSKRIAKDAVAGAVAPIAAVAGSARGSSSVAPTTRCTTRGKLVSHGAIKATPNRLMHHHHHSAVGVGGAEEDMLVIDEIIEADTVTSTTSSSGSGGIRYQSNEDDGWERYGSSNTAAHDGGANNKDTGSSHGNGAASSFSEVDTIDAYARARVMNYVKRHGGSSSSSEGVGGANAFTVKTIEGSDGGGGLVHASIVIPMPDPAFGRRVGEGIAATAKDAEHLAAMHAERIINTLGLQLYGMPSSQERYALQLRKSSHGTLWAPLPSDQPRPYDTPSPPLLQLKNAKEKAAMARRSVAASAVASAAPTVQEYTLTCRSANLGTALDYTLTSPNFIDHNALKRLRGYLGDHRVSMGKAATMIKLHKPPAGVKVPTNSTSDSSNGSSHPPNSKEAQLRAHMQSKVDEREEEFEYEEWDTDPSLLQFPDERGQRVALNDGQTLLKARKGSDAYTQVQHGTTTSDVQYCERGQWYLCQIIIPGTPPEVGEVVAMGRAPDSRIATQLAAMHAELLIDAMGLPLFPSNPIAQMHHSRECAKVGRWAVAPMNGSSVDASNSNTSAANPAVAQLEAIQSGAYRGIKPLQFTLEDLSRPGVPTTTAGTSLSTGGLNIFTTEAADGTRISIIDEHSGADGNASGNSPSTALLSHAKVLDKLTLQNCTITFQDHSARSRLRDYLERIAKEAVQLIDGAAAGDVTGSFLCPATGRIKFYTERFGMHGNYTYRASITVPTPNPELYGRRVACGVGSTEDMAECVCAMHALQLLGELHIPVYADPNLQQEYHRAMALCGGTAAHYQASVREAAIADLSQRYPPNTNGDVMTHEIGNLTAVPSPPLFKLLTRDKTGRVYFGCSREEEAVEWGTMADRKPTDEAYEAMLGTGQKLSHRDYWCLNPDAEVPSDLYDLANNLPQLLDFSSTIVPSVTLGINGRDRIIIAPTAKLDAGRMFIHTLSGARQFDSKSIERLYDYLERNGRPLQSYHTAVFMEREDGSNDSGNEGEGGATIGSKTRQLYRVTCPLPVPAHFGTRVAIGEAPTAELALRCASVHAELVLDAIGVRLYDHDIFQRRHAETARKTGRWAPLPETVIPFEAAASFPSPPAVRLEEEGSAVWRQVLWSKGGGGGVVDPSSTSPAAAATATYDAAAEAQLDEALEADGFSFLKDLLPSQTDEDAINAGLGGVGDDPSGCANATDDSMDLARYEAVVSSKLRLSTRNRVEYFFHSHNADTSRIDRWSAKPKGWKQTIFFAALVMPFPEQYGLRVARGAAMTRRDAALVCLTHAERMIDALGFRVSPINNVQWQHHNRCREEGRFAPTPFDTPKSHDTPTSFGLKSVVEVVEQTMPQMPTFDPITQRLIDDGTLDAATQSRYFPTNGAPMDAYDAWFMYARQCDMYILQQEANVLNEAADKIITPRSGEPFEDDALTIVEKYKISKTAIVSARDFVRKNGFEVPDKIDATSIGTGVGKRYYASVKVIGTPYTAHGLCEQRHDAICLASMHYQQIVNAILVSNALAKAGVVQGVGAGGGGGDDADGDLGEHLLGGDSPTATAGSANSNALDGLLFDPVQQSFTARGKRIAVRFFAELTPPHKGVVETVKRPLTAADDHHHLVATVALEDSVGLKQLFKHEMKQPMKRVGDDGAVVEEDEAAILAAMRATLLGKCYNDLFTALSSKTQSFTTFLQLLKVHPRLRLALAIKAKFGGKETAELTEKVRVIMIANAQNAAKQQQQLIGGAMGGRGGAPTTLAPIIPTAKALGPGAEVNDPANLERLERTAQIAKLGAVLTHCTRTILLGSGSDGAAAQPQQAINISKKASSPSPADLSQEVMREEHAQLLASYISQRPMGDVAAFDQDVSTVMGLGEGDGEAGGYEGNSSAEADDTSPTTAANKLLDTVDSVFVDTATRTIGDLQRNNFVTSFVVTYEEVQRLLGEAKAAAGKGALSANAPHHHADNTALATSTSSTTPPPSGTPEARVRQEELTVAMPTLYGAVTTLIASRLCKLWHKGRKEAEAVNAKVREAQQQKQAQSSTPTQLSAAALTATRADIDRALALAKMLVAAALMPNRAVYDCAVTAVACGEDAFLLMGGSDVSSSVSEKCLKLTAEAVGASAAGGGAPTAASTNNATNTKMRVVSQRKAVHSLVVDALKDLRQHVVRANGSGSDGNNKPTTSVLGRQPIGALQHSQQASQQQHPDMGKLRGLVTAVEDAFNSTTPKLVAGMGGVGGSGSAANSPLGGLKAATAVAAAPALFDACATLALVPNFRLEVINPNKKVVDGDGSGDKSGGNGTNPSAGDKPASIPANGVVANSQSTLPKTAAAMDPSAATNTSTAAAAPNASLIDYQQYPPGSLLPNGGMVRVVPQRLGVAVRAGSNAAAGNASSSSPTVTSAAAAPSGRGGAPVGASPTAGGGSWTSAVANQKAAGGGGWGSFANKATSSRGGSANAPSGGSAQPHTRTSTTAASNATKAAPIFIKAKLALPLATAAPTAASSSPQQQQQQPPTPVVITVPNPLALYLLSSSAVAKPSADGLTIGIVNGTLPIFAEDAATFTAVERLRQAIMHHVATATPMPVPIVTLLTGILSSSGEATSVDTDLGGGQHQQ